MHYATVMEKLRTFKIRGDWPPTIFLLPEGAMRGIYDLIVDNNLKTCLELGSGHGATSCVIGAAAQETGGKATTIDIRLHEPANAQLLKDHIGLGPELEVICDPLGYNWWIADLLRKQPAKKVYQPIYDFIFLDGAHEWQPDALASFMAVGLLKPGGWLVLDDLNYLLRGNPEWKKSHGHLSDRELDSCQIGMVWDLVVRQHPDLENFSVTEGGRVGWAQKKRKASQASVLGRMFTKEPATV